MVTFGPGTATSLSVRLPAGRTLELSGMAIGRRQGPFAGKEDVMRVLVAYATRHGATAGIAERVAAVLTAAGLPADARAVEDVENIEPYGAVVVGGAAYMFHWLKPAVRFSRRHRKELTARPVWLFSSGPLGTDVVDKDGKSVLETSRPKEFDELTKLLNPRGTEVFFGAWDPDAAPVGLGERFVQHVPAARAALPAGDFRDWPAIEAWAAHIAAELGGADPCSRSPMGTCASPTSRA
jgi:menaquinone-dependent protoporphyrinogen oxidase